VAVLEAVLVLRGVLAAVVLVQLLEHLEQSTQVAAVVVLEALLVLPLVVQVS
jgi:hypothetical protein